MRTSHLVGPVVAAVAALLSLTTSGVGNGTLPATPATARVPFTKTSLKGALRRGAKVAIAGDTLILSSTTDSGETAAVPVCSWGPGATSITMPFGLTMADQTCRSGIQVIFDATGPNDGTVEVDVFARSNGSGIIISGGLFGGSPPNSVTFAGVDGVVLRAQKDGSENVTVGASPDGEAFTDLFTLAGASIPPHVAGTTPILVSVAQHEGAKGTVTGVASPTKTMSFDAGAINDALLQIEAARVCECQALGAMRREDLAEVAAKMGIAIDFLKEALGTLESSDYADSAPGKAAIKALQSAISDDGEARGYGAGLFAIHPLGRASKSKEDAIVEFRKF